MKKFCFLFLAIVASLLFGLSEGIKSRTSQAIRDKISNTAVLADVKDELLLISTLDGALHAVTKAKGIKRWTLKDEPVIQNPSNPDTPPVPQFFPNPKDGSLYRYTAGRGSEPLTKFPFTIPELVSSSPCRSNDGIFYIGKKVDTLVGVDSITGKKQLVLGSDADEKVCPKPSLNTIYLGRTLYNLVLFELDTGHKWNVSFCHYSTSSASSELKNYDLIHYTATGEGSILTVDQKTGIPVWTLELDSPVISMYTLDTDKSTLASVPLTTVTSQTLRRISCNLKEFNQMVPGETSRDLLIKDLSPTIFVGASENGVYALPAFVDTNTARITRRQSHLLLGGPPGQRATIETASDAEEENEYSDVLLLGYYDLPESSKTEFQIEIETLTEAGLPLGITHQNISSTIAPEVKSTEETPKIQQHVFWFGINQTLQGNLTFIFSRDFIRWTSTLSGLSLQWVVSNPLNFVVAILSAGFGVIIFLLYRQAQEYARLNREMSSRRNNSSRGSSGHGSGDEITAVSEELDDGTIRVGKIIFNPRNLLGKGCDGTFVFGGTFDGRSVAVKRVLPACFSIADREVELLRQSDQHPNVIRYYCTEQCREFRYITLELCAATLEDLVNKKTDIKIPSILLLRQATAGLHHLHSLDIVHRDIKPHNVLISLPNSKGEARAMISDFGLCKRLEVGRMSFSKKSGVTGTEGWIAPEMINADERPTSKVDIFSLGCVYYYVLSEGHHPFGNILDRQSNIRSNKYLLDMLDAHDQILSRSLIENMISSEPSERPPTPAILMHPLFWTPDKILQFFQEVSDRVEKEEGHSSVVRNLEWGNAEVVRDDWTKHMHPIIGEDLRKFREYNGRSVRDLLRALRNKKNHYRELSSEARNVFGRIPEDFVPYWSLRFPRLLLHSWCALQICKAEPIFSKYYSNFSFKHENVHKTISLAPNNRRPSYSVSQNRSSTEPKDGKKDPFGFVDSMLGPIVKGPKRPQKHDKGKEPSPWLLNKPQNTFDPIFTKPTIAISDEPLRAASVEQPTVVEPATEFPETSREENREKLKSGEPASPSEKSFEESERGGENTGQSKEKKRGKKKKKGIDEKINEMFNNQ